MKLYHGTNCSSAMNIIGGGVDLKYSKPYLDFGAGFYTTPSYEHAAAAAIRATQKYNAKYNTCEEPYVVEVDFRIKKELELSTALYPRHSETWGKFVLNNRLNKNILSEYSIVEHNQDAKYDICCGEIADGSIINIAYKVNNKMISLEDVDYKEFLKDNGEVYPQQYSFHTPNAVSCITVLSCGTIKKQAKIFKNSRRRRAV